MLQLLEELCALDGPSGCEDRVRDYIREKGAFFADEVLEDPVGNLMLLRRGQEHREKPVMLCAHMDEVGVIVKRITDEGKRVCPACTRGLCRRRRPTGGDWTAYPFYERREGGCRHQGCALDDSIRTRDYAKDEGFIY